MLFLLLKTAHVLGSTVFFGTGLGSVWFRLHAVKSGQVGLVAWADAAVVKADWWFTVPAAVLMPASGLWLVEIYRMPLTTPWVLAGLVDYAVAGLTWLPAAFLQVRLQRLSAKAVAEGAPLPASWHLAHRMWLALGVPSFTATMFVFWVMVSKSVPWS
jgi:uncharacterized membrane protein